MWISAGLIAPRHVRDNERKPYSISTTVRVLSSPATATHRRIKSETAWLSQLPNIIPNQLDLQTCTCLSQWNRFSTKENAPTRPIDLPHLPIAPKTEKSSADPPPTLLCKLLNIGSEQASSEQTTSPQQNSAHLLTKKKRCVATRRKYFLTTVIYFLTTVIEGSQAKLHTKQNKTTRDLLNVLLLIGRRWSKPSMAYVKA